MKNKIKSYSVWTALSGAVVVLLQALGKCFGFSIDSDIVTGIIMAVAGILVVFGVVSMPNSNNDQQNNQTDNTESCDEETVAKNDSTEDEEK